LTCRELWLGRIPPRARLEAGGPHVWIALTFGCSEHLRPSHRRSPYPRRVAGFPGRSAGGRCLARFGASEATGGPLGSINRLRNRSSRSPCPLRSMLLWSSGDRGRREGECPI
jgi:hypothetical protein